LQIFNKATFADFISVRAEYPNALLELFNNFFMNEMSNFKIRKEIVQSVRTLGLWLNDVAFRVGAKEATNQKKPDKKYEYKAKCLIELESGVFGARRPSEILNVIIRAGRLSGDSAPAGSEVFQEALLTGEINFDDAKSMLMAYARTRNYYEAKPKIDITSTLLEEQDDDSDASH
jgi:hypothetical protein